MADNKTETLQQLVQDLTQACAQLMEDKAELQAHCRQLDDDRSQLLRRHHQVRKQVEGLVTRLKKLEADQS